MLTDNKAKKHLSPTARIKLADLSLLSVAILWGAGFTAVQYCLKSGMSAALMLSIRFSIAAAIVLLLKPKTVFKMSKYELINGFLAGALLFFSFLMQTLGQYKTSISNSAFITTVYVIIVPFIMWAVLKKPPKLKIFILVFAALAGVIILTYKKGESLFSFGIGELYLFLCAAGFAAHIVFLGIRAKALNPVNITFVQLLTCAVFGTAMFFLTENPAELAIDWKTGLPALLYIAVFSTALCFFVQTWAQTVTTPSKAAIIMSSESLFGPLIAIVIGIEAFRLNIIIGGLIILGSVVLSEIEFKKTKTTNQAAYMKDNI